MKYMKLGSKPDAFQAEGNYVRYVSSELDTDVIISVGDVKFLLHKFPLLAKSNRLRKLVSGVSEESPDEIRLADFPGGPNAFEICAKFCYGVTVTLNPYNVVAARCAAEYLEMSEDFDRGNLNLKIDIFLNSSVLHNWKDSIIVLQTSKSLLPWSENLKIVGRCIDSIASKTSVDPSLVTWSYTYNRRLATSDQIIRSGLKLSEKMESVPRDWWIEDICELDIDLYKRVMLAIKSKGRMDGGMIGKALKAYAMRWLPDSADAVVSEVHINRNKSLVETIMCLLTSDKGISCACSFLLKLLKVAILIEADDSSREELIKNISSKLDDASVSDLLIPARPPQTTIYDIELVQRLVDLFVENEMSKKDKKMNEKDGGDFVLGHGSWLKVGKIIDGYLAAVARDRNLTVSSFIKLSESVPEMARPIHDGLYGAIDIFLKEHSGITKSEKKILCGLMDVKKLTTDATMHAAQNDQLPLRVVVQVLFFEQARAAVATHAFSEKSLSKQMDELKVKEEESVKNGKLIKRSSKNRRSRRIFERLWIAGKGLPNGDNKIPETLGSSQSPTSMIRGETKSSGLSTRHRRNSIS
ncbi:BTB/POZ domain-containing protein NPY1-like [Salvia splendens]|uniref:BTB/POZ domain-containing protein NPY1-like n=1 Tax=Salvia splendens TaxID=180675 RepID=UPI001C25BA4C|nr:BTB/POZ domain-containing protein NPY1-like [Salvia splendens]XP_042003411.1 BTB/POZ domain-containing protein NPY1-like [Salvia splendens]XP_042003412.1 BTB/POZ domain-containing protein NPY1-like [Salvia splendens]XP_042003413.1 BTB/POZ domain-containing protein NPY1-like [Salvia splendens]